MKKRIIIGSIIVVVAGLIVWGIVASQKKAPTPTIKATLGDISRNVLVTGTTKPVQSVDLSFERTGKVTGVYVSIGDKVKSGQPLVEIDRSDLAVQLSQAQAALAAQQAQLDALKKGTRPEQLAVQEVVVANAQVAVVQAQKTLLDSLNDAYAKTDDATRNKTDESFLNPRNVTPSLLFQSTNPQHNIDLPAKKADMETVLGAWQTSLASLSSNSDLLAESAKARTNLEQAKSFLDELVQALNSAIPTTSSASIQTWQTDASAARSEIGVAITSLSGSETALRSAQSNLTLQKNTLLLNQAGSTAEQIAAQQALVDQAKASVAGINVQLAKTVLRSPIDGVITVQGAKLGQIVTVTTAAIANSSLISVISEKKLEIDANIPEVDIGHLVVGQPVKITFDALPGESFKGLVMEIDPAETVISGVVNYAIKVSLESVDPRIKSGLTANLTIETAVKKGVVLLPQYAVLQNDQGTFVRVASGNTTKDLPITLGIRGADGNVEIVSGLSAGDEVQNVGLKTK